MANLTELFLHDNQLTAVPKSLGELTALKYLFLHGNPALGIPNSVLGPAYDKVFGFDGRRRKPPARPADILNFYFSRQKAARSGTLRRLNEMKVMLVGDGGAGKTSLLRFFKGEPHDAKEPETLGIALDTFSLKRDGETIRVRLWDLAGQEITNSLHQFFLTEGCVYLVVVEPRGDNEQGDAEKWLQLIERYGKGSPALVVMNKQDTRQPRGYDLDAHALWERFPFIRGFSPTSCGASRKGCAGRDGARGAGLDAGGQAGGAGQLGRGKGRLLCPARDRGGEALSVAGGVSRAMREPRETEPEKQESLARLLHKLGAVLHFVDEPRLRDTTVLNPYWVTDGAYRLLRCKDGPGSDGC